MGWTGGQSHPVRDWEGTVTARAALKMVELQRDDRRGTTRGWGVGGDSINMMDNLSMQRAAVNSYE